jgi:hypothetical protein
LNGFNPDNVELDGYWQHELGLFIQDTWQPKPNLTVNVGLRYEAQNHDDPQYPILGNTGQIPMVRQAPGTDLRPVPQTIKDDKNNFGPRLGVSWDPSTDGKTVIRGAVGLYCGRTASIFLPTAGSGFRDSALFMFPPPVSTRASSRPSSLRRDSSRSHSAPTIGFVSEEFENPRVLNFNIGGETEILPNLSVGTDFIYSKSNNLRIGRRLRLLHHLRPEHVPAHRYRPVRKADRHRCRIHRHRRRRSDPEKARPHRRSRGHAL